MAKSKKDDSAPGAPLWMITYGDLMSLLLTFFVLLLSFATMDKPRELQEAIISIRGAFGVMPAEMTQLRVNPSPMRIRRPNKESEDAARRIQRGLQVMGLQNDVKVKYDAEGGLKITLPSQILYEPGQTRLRPEVYPMLEDIGNLLAEMPETFFEVRGHTDDTGLSLDTLFRDNLDLSYARADAVVRFLNETSGIPMNLFEIIACGSGQPVATNTTVEGQRANRRVEIFVRGLLSRSRAEELQGRVDELTKVP